MGWIIFNVWLILLIFDVVLLLVFVSKKWGFFWLIWVINVFMVVVVILGFLLIVYFFKGSWFNFVSGYLNLVIIVLDVGFLLVCL